jgi:predicted phosphodiesterase
MPLSQAQARAYREKVQQALDHTYKKTPPDELRLDIQAARVIIFSDLHRGARNRADDFRLAERAYNAALAYYFRLGYTLVVLGDVEELWEERIATVINSYQYSLSLEAKFHQAGRYLRVWGNHDDDWADPKTVAQHLGPIFGPQPLKAHESLLMTLVEGEQTLGRLFLVHGHQGTTASDRYSGLSRVVVRYFWRNWQRITGRSLNTPAKDWELRDNHNIALYSWAAKQSKLILVAGHTHRPVFESHSHPAQIQEEMATVQAKLDSNPYDADLQEQAAKLSAELEWVRAQDAEHQRTGLEGNTSVAMSKPCYFNSGCCCFSDGDITGLEITNGEIRLIRLPNQDEKPIRQVLARASLRDVLRRC